MAVKPYTVRGKKLWLVDFWIKLPDGQPSRYREKQFRTKAEAEARKAEVTVQANMGLWNRKAETATVRDAWEYYEDVTLTQNKTGKDDVSRAKRLLDHLGGARVSVLNAATIRRYRVARSKEPTRKGTPPTVATLNREIGLLKRMLNHAEREGYINTNPIARVRLEAENNVRHNVIDDDRFTELHNSADQWFRPILRIAFDTGMRRSEILSLRWSQVNLKEGTITLEAKDTKTASARLIPLTGCVREVFAQQPKVLGASEYVFANPRTGRPYSEVKTALKRACDKVGLVGFWFHDLRRCFITNARKRGIPESVIMRISGHKSRNVFERYNVIDEADLWEAVRKIENGREKEDGDNTVALEG